MTHPTHFVGQLSVAAAMRQITDREMTIMCLAVNQQMGTAGANKLLALFGSARQLVKAEQLVNEAPHG